MSGIKTIKNFNPRNITQIVDQGLKWVQEQADASVQRGTQVKTCREAIKNIQDGYRAKAHPQTPSSQTRLSPSFWRYERVPNSEFEKKHRGQVTGEIDLAKWESVLPELVGAKDLKVYQGDFDNDGEADDYAFTLGQGVHVFFNPRLVLHHPTTFLITGPALSLRARQATPATEPGLVKGGGSADLEPFAYFYRPKSDRPTRRSASDQKREGAGIPFRMGNKPLEKSLNVPKDIFVYRHPNDLPGFHEYRVTNNKDVVLNGDTVRPEYQNLFVMVRDPQEGGVILSYADYKRWRAGRENGEKLFPTRLRNIRSNSDTFEK